MYLDALLSYNSKSFEMYLIANDNNWRKILSLANDSGPDTVY